MLEIKCPYCNASYFQENYSVSTAVGWVPVYKDGIQINDNPNVTTTFCTCLNCSHNFSYRVNCGKIIDIEDLGVIDLVPTINESITATTDESTVTTTTTLEIKPEEIQVHYIWEDEIEKLHDEVHQIAEEIKDLRDMIRGTMNEVDNMLNISTQMENHLE